MNCSMHTWSNIMSSFPSEAAGFVRPKCGEDMETWGDVEKAVHASISCRLDPVLHWPGSASEHILKCLFVFKALSGRAPSYLWETLKPHQPWRAWRFARRPTQQVQLPGWWQVLSCGTHQNSTRDRTPFKSKLKTFLLRGAFNTLCFVTVCNYYWILSADLYLK